MFYRPTKSLHFIGTKDSEEDTRNIETSTGLLPGLTASDSIVRTDRYVALIKDLGAL